MDKPELVATAVSEIVNGGNLKLADEVFSNDYINHGGLIADLVRGPEGVKASLALYRLAYPDFLVRTEALTTEGDAVELRWSAYSNPSLVTQDSRGLRGITRCHFDGDAISESWTAWDRERSPFTLWRPRQSGSRTPTGPTHVH